MQLGMGGTERQSWLHGLKVIDITNVIAGPYIGSTLARFGADVIKIDPKKPTYDGLVAVLMGVPPGRGKRSLLADLKTATGKEVLEKLIKWADVVLVNQAPCQLAALGVDEVSLKKINPHVILGLFTAFGGPGWGPRSDFIGYDDLVQASTGIMSRFGGGLDTPEEHAHLGTIDVVSGFSGALAVCFALLKRRRTGQSDVACSSLAANGQFIQTEFMFDYDGMEHGTEPSGPDARGTHALYRWYEAADEWIFVASPKQLVPTEEADRDQLTAIVQGLPETGAGSRSQDLDVLLSIVSDEGLVEYLGAAFKQMTAAEALHALENGGVAGYKRGTMAGIREANVSGADHFTLQDHPSASGKTFQFTQTPDHPIGSSVTIISPCAMRATNAVVKNPSTAPKYGEHSREVLEELGYTATQINSFVEDGSIAESWSEQYLADGDPWAAQEKAYNEYVDDAARS